MGAGRFAAIGEAATKKIRNLLIRQQRFGVQTGGGQGMKLLAARFMFWFCVLSIATFFGFGVYNLVAFWPDTWPGAICWACMIAPLIGAIHWQGELSLILSACDIRDRIRWEVEQARTESPPSNQP